MIRALKHYPDDPEEAQRPKALRADLRVQFVTPRTPVTLPDPLPGDCLESAPDYTADPLALAEIRNGAVLRDGSFVFTERNELLRESVDRLSFADKLFSSHQELEQNLDATPTEPSPDTVTVIGSQRANNYFHWWIDVLAKCWLIQSSPYRTCHLITPPLTQSFQRESLDLLGLRTTPMTRPIHRFRRTLAIRGLTHGSSQAIVPQVAEFARWCRAKLTLPLSPRSRKLFLSRRRARNRRLVNEEEVLALLGADFELIEPETMSVQEQALLFSQAEMIVAPHGASLTNLLLCTQPTPVLELVNDQEPPHTYRRLAALLGHPYIAVGCKSGPTARPLKKRDIKARPSAVRNAAARLHRSSIAAQ